MWENLREVFYLVEVESPLWYARFDVILYSVLHLGSTSIGGGGKHFCLPSITPSHHGQINVARVNR